MTCRNRGALLASALAVLVVAASAAPADAQDVMSSDRPRFTERTVSVAPGTLQLEAGYTFARFGELDSHRLGEALVRFGVIPGLELRVGLPSFITANADVGPVEFDESGFGDAHLGMKLGLYESGLAEGLPSVALLLGTGVPTGDDDLPLSAESWEPEAKLALAWSFTERLGLGVNVNYAQRDPEFVDRYDEWAASVALDLPLTARLSGFGEYFAIRPEFEGSGVAQRDYIAGGATWLLTPDLQLDARIGLGVDSPAEDDFFFGVGLATRF